jgi:hypothetical protein
MLRATFFAGGVFIALWGTAFLFVDQIVLKAQEDYVMQPERPAGFRGLFMPSGQPETITGKRPKVLDIPQWAAFSLISIGGVTMLYAAALPKRRYDD